MFHYAAEIREDHVRNPLEKCGCEDNWRPVASLCIVLPENRFEIRIIV
jgi:hypothetical protein